MSYYPLMSKVSIDKFSKALKVLHDGQQKVLDMNEGSTVTEETLLWSEYYVKKMLLVLSDVERGKEPFDLDIEIA